MMMLDIPADGQPGFAVVAAQSSQSQRADVAPQRAMGVCNPVTYRQKGQPYEYTNPLSPGYMAVDYFLLYKGLRVSQPEPGGIKVLESPRHGRIDYSIYTDGYAHHGYIPDPDYVGDDKIVFEVNTSAGPVKLVYILKVVRYITAGQIPNEVFCGKTPPQWKISLQSAFTFNPDTWQRSAALSGLPAPASSPAAPHRSLAGAGTIRTRP